MLRDVVPLLILSSLIGHGEEGDGASRDRIRGDMRFPRAALTASKSRVALLNREAAWTGLAQPQVLLRTRPSYFSRANCKGPVDRLCKPSSAMASHGSTGGFCLRRAPWSHWREIPPDRTQAA